MLRSLIRIGVIVPALVWALGASDLAVAQTAAAPTICQDGTTSNATGRGACSGHGGVQKSSKANPAPAATPSTSTTAPGSASAPSAPSPTSSSSTAPATRAKSTSSATGQGTATSGAAPAGATAQCKDGSYSKSKHHSGTCSHHGGVQQWLDGSGSAQ